MLHNQHKSVAISGSGLKSWEALLRSMLVIQIETTVTEIRMWSTVPAHIIARGVNLVKYVWGFLPDFVGSLPYSSHCSFPLWLQGSYSHQQDTKDVLWRGRVEQWLKLPLQIHPVPSGRLTWGKDVESWKSLHVLLKAHIHLQQIAAPLVPCKSLRNAAEVWDLPQRDLESLWKEKWRICLTFINLAVLIYFYRKIVSHTYFNKNVQLERILHEPTSPINHGCIQYLKVFAIKFESIIFRQEVFSLTFLYLLLVMGHIAWLCLLT